MGTATLTLLIGLFSFEVLIVGSIFFSPNTAVVYKMSINKDLDLMAEIINLLEKCLLR